MVSRHSEVFCNSAIRMSSKLDEFVLGWKTRMGNLAYWSGDVDDVWRWLVLFITVTFILFMISYI